MVNSPSFSKLGFKEQVPLGSAAVDTAADASVLEGPGYIGSTDVLEEAADKVL